MILRRPTLQLVIGLVMLPAIWAHHGSEFIALDDYDIGHAGDGLLNAGFDLERFGGEDELSAEIDAFVTPLPRVGLGVNVRFAEDGRGDWVYSSVSPRVQVQLTDPHAEGRFKLGLSFGYQFAEDLSYDETTTSYEEIVIRRPAERRVTVAAAPAPSGGGEGGGTGGGEPDCNPLFDLDCTPPSGGRTPKHTGSHAPVVTGTRTTTVSAGGETVTRRVEKTTTTRKGVSSHRGIHNHDARQWFGRLIIETEIGKTKLTGNLISTVPEDDHAYWGYGLGARRPLTDRIAAGLEVTGDFIEGGEHEAIASVHYRFTDRATARLGLGVGLTDESPDFTLRTGLVWRF